MNTYVIRRCLQSLIVFGAILVIVFLMLQITGDPAAVLMPLDATEEDLQAFRQEMGFDKPLYIQFGRFLFGGPKTDGVIRGDFGFSYRHEIPALGLVLEHFRIRRS
jgi:peptide/nickel transport system permease protein